MNFLRFSILFCAVVTVVYSQQTPKWEVSRTELRLGYSWGYHVLPVDMTQAYNLGWTLLGTSCDHNGTFYGYRMVGYVESLFGLYDANGILAGVQIPIGCKYSGPIDEGVTQTYTVYFVDYEYSICKNGRTLAELSATGLTQPHFHTQRSYGYDGVFPGHQLHLGNAHASVKSINISGGYTTGNYTG